MSIVEGHKWHSGKKQEAQIWFYLVYLLSTPNNWKCLASFNNLNQRYPYELVRGQFDLQKKEFHRLQWNLDKWGAPGNNFFPHPPIPHFVLEQWNLDKWGVSGKFLPHSPFRGMGEVSVRKTIRKMCCILDSYEIAKLSQNSYKKVCLYLWFR